MSVKEKIGCVTTVILFVVFLVSIFSYFLFRPAPIYETNDVADYGIVKGNYDNDTPQEFISSFFPERIESYFEDVQYHYKAKKSDTFAYEMYMEFVIQDTQTYNAFIADVIGDNAAEPFYFDPDYQINYVYNYLELSPDRTKRYDNKSKQTVWKEDKSKPPIIQAAKIGAVLFSDTEQRIIFFAFGLYDGGGTSTDELDYFFNRFEINPWVYQKRTGDGSAR